MLSLLMVALCYSAALANDANDTNDTNDREILQPLKDYRIIGGFDAEDMEFPFIVSLRTISHEFYCGATILTPYSLLSAAHCCRTGKAVEIMAGSIELNRFRQIIDIKGVISHTKFNNDGKSGNDICVIKLQSPLHYNNRVKPVKLPRYAPNLPAGTPLVAIGWGAFETPPPEPAPFPSSNRLQAFENYHYLPNSLCEKRSLRFHFKPTDGQLCVISPPGLGTCNGDSGGPLLWGDIQVGITSFGLKRCDSAQPAIFTRVFAYINWIRNVLGPEARLLQFGP